MVRIRARERRSAADHARALYYNGLNGIDPCLVLEDVNALVALPSDPAARRLAEAHVGGPEKRKSWFEFAFFASVSPLPPFFF
jgi:hypothetical protein